MPVSQPSLVSVLAGSAMIALFAGSSCKRDKEPEVAGYQPGQPQYGQAGYAGSTGYAGAPAYAGSTGYAGAPAYAGSTGYAGAPAYAGAGGAAPLPGAAGAAGTTGQSGKATALDPGAAAVVQPVMNELAKQHIVAGSKPLGSILAGNFQTGQTLEAQIQLQPNKCYSIVASSLPPVTELNLQLVAATPLPTLAPVLAADSETGPTAIIGKKPNCYKWAFPLPAAARVVIQVAAGSGLAGAQVYEK